ncbi:MAG: maltose alpha-D-glucosyltransferase [Bacteroidetes bacterium]|nr:maltose alpha-D-glucosyltransferase [Bacteroidota bacterium]MBS1541239.1 maltose alpha-D-glucosyltransferase [Bacteroidota bacterium]
MAGIIKNDLLWFKDAIIYELSVRSFCDSNGDGIGDFPGLISKLDYLEDLGVNTIWLLPFFDSPLKDDGYDVVDHTAVHADYGTQADFRLFLKEAHAHGMRVITELILNHTSDQHPWFQKSRKARAGSKFKNYYVWSEDPEKYKDARLMFPQEEPSNWSWDNEAKSYYWHRFYRHMPELNYDNPEVQLEMIKVIDYWLKLGVDGFRLSSIPFLFEKEGTSCENLPETHEFLKKIRTYVDKHYENKILIAEANLWPEDAAEYFGKGDECHMSFNYPLMPRLFLSLRTEDSYPIIDIIEQTPTTAETNQWALFLRNHDEIGLEMVTEEEKDFLFKAYATDPHVKHNIGIRRRLAPLLNNDRRKIELLYTLLFSLPGTPVLYYGDEIGMGDNIYLGDRFGVRTPMQWNVNLNAGFSTANPQKLFLPVIADPAYRYESINVATQEENHSSLLWWIRNVMAMRKRLGVFGRGDLKFLESSNAKVLCFVRTFKNQKVAVVANLSQFSQSATLDFSAYKDCDVTEVFSQNRFNSIDNGDYTITLGPYGYFWLQLDVSEKKEQVSASGELPLFQSDLSWERTFSNYENIRFLERKVLQSFIKKCRWFGGKARTISKVGIHKMIPVKAEGEMHYLSIMEVHYVQRLPEFYFLPIYFAPSDTLFDKVEFVAQSVICRADFQGKTGFLVDSSYDKGFRDFLFQAMDRKVRMKDEEGTLEFNSSVYVKLNADTVDSKLLKAEQSNTSIIYNDKFFFKFYRKIEKEINPDLEIIRFLSENTNFRNSPKYAGSIEYHDNDGQVMVFGLLQEKVDNQGDSWAMTLDSVGRFYERVMTRAKKEKPPKLNNKSSVTFEEAPELIQELIGQGFYERVVRLGQRTAEMHLALASDKTNLAFAPEYFTANYQRSLYSSLRKLLRDRLKLLEQSLSKFNVQTQALAKEVLAAEELILECFSEIYQVKMQAIKTRIHGDYHLGQVLFTGKDFVIIDFEGEPGFTFSERRLKKNPLKDVAGMMRSFHYAALGKILLNENYREKDLELLGQWAEQWQHYVSRFYMGAYMEKMGLGKNLPEAEEVLMRVYLLEKAIYELGYELNGRPDWVVIPLRGIMYQVNRYLLAKELKKGN